MLSGEQDPHLRLSPSWGSCVRAYSPPWGLGLPPSEEEAFSSIYPSERNILGPLPSQGRFLRTSIIQRICRVVSGESMVWPTASARALALLFALQLPLNTCTLQDLLKSHWKGNAGAFGPPWVSGLSLRMAASSQLHYIAGDVDLSLMKAGSGLGRVWELL